MEQTERGFASAAEYRALPAMNYSVLKEMARSPLHARHAMLTPREETPALILGEAIHYGALQPDLFEKRYAVPPKVDKRTVAGKAAWAEWQAEHPGYVPLSPDEWESCQGVIRACQSHRVASDLLAGKGRNEVGIRWQSSSGVECKGRIDRIRSEYDGWTVLIDLKSARDASPWAFGAAVAKYKYHWQAAMYLDGCDAIRPLARRFVHVVTEKDPPYAVGVYELTQAAIEQGRREYKAALVRWKECVDTGMWPGYSEGVVDVDLPRWAQIAEVIE